MLRWICALAMVWLLVMATNATAASPIPLEQRLTAARAELAAADAQKPSQPAAQAAAVERLFDLLDEGGQLDSDEAQKLVDSDPALHDAGQDATVYALALERRARVQLARDRFDDAVATVRRAHEMLQQTVPPDEDADASIRITFGRALTARTKFKDAIAALEPAVATLDARHVVDLRLDRALQALAYDYVTLAKTAPAQNAIRRAIDIATTLDGADGPLAAEDRTVAALIQRLHGDLAGAIETTEHAVSTLRIATPQRSAPLVRALQSLAQLYVVSGDCAHAESLDREGIAIAKTRASSAGYSLAALYVDLGTCLAHTGHYAEAADYQQRALTRYRKIVGPDGRKSLIAENNLATDYAYLHRLDEAAALLRHVIAANERNPSSVDSYTLQARFNLAAIDVWQGHYADAETMYRSYVANAGAHRALGSDYPRVSAEGLAVSLWAQGRDEEAFREALALGQYSLRIARDAGLGLDERHTISLYSKQDGGNLSWALAIAAHTQRPEQLRAAWAMAIESRGLATAISARRLAVARATADPRIAAVWNEWKQRDEALVQARVAAAHAPSAQTTSALDAAERAYDDTERSLALAAGSSAKLSQGTHAGLREILAALPGNTALVSYAETDSSQPGDFQRPQAERHGRVYAFAATRGTQPKLLDLGPRPAIHDATTKWMALLSDRNADLAARDAAGAKLREMIWDPVAKHWQQQHVLIVASPMLDRVPFAALPAKDGKFLVEAGYAFHLLDHERDALAITTATQADTLSLIGAPDFGVDTRLADTGTRGVCAGLRGATFSPLPQSAREIDELASLWKQQAGATTPTVLTGDDANEAGARAVLHGSRIIHFATHAVYLGDQCTTADDTRGIKTVETTATSQAVQDLSALVLTGANRPATNTENDGLLTSEEVATLDLTGTDWAVLSACDTGVGKDIPGEGVFGLRRAFRLAGVHSVIMSLWPVSDAASADWMVALYRARLQQHASTIDSVRAADLALIKQRRDAGLDPAPYYWAAFVAAGDWR
ncbi:MAG TPA: CHAT domain-containing tetratricopeptide repeat protein [Rudaea sp.]|jgi:CHAT domain-containing protein/tetratricopeptide (TPR) repeat protein